MDNMIYTIGYTAFTIDEFIKQLKSLNINCLIDVRTTPIASDFYKIYSKQSLQPLLKEHDILYMNFDKEFGARQPEEEFYKKYRYLDFEAFIQSDLFLSGVKRLKKGCELGNRIALMCAEKDPINCHRAIMVARGLKNNDLKVAHILATGELETHESLEERLVDTWFPNRKQLGLFEQQSFESYLQQAYRQQNAKIGYIKQ